MMRRLAPLALLSILTAFPAQAAERSFAIGTFERVRVDGPFEVRVVTGRAPGAKASGDAQLLERLKIELNGTMLVVRLGSGGWGETPRGRVTEPLAITLATPRLTAAALSAGARAEVDRMKAQRVDVSVAGAGALTVTNMDADQLAAVLVGAGTMTLAGRANRARLSTNGPGAIDAEGLTVNDLTVTLDGAGDTKAAARYTAQVVSTGLGRVTVGGNAKCTVKANAGGPVTCGVGR